VLLVDDHTAYKTLKTLKKIQVAYQEKLTYQTARILHHHFCVCIKLNRRYALKSVVKEQKFTEFYNKLL